MQSSSATSTPKTPKKYKFVLVNWDTKSAGTSSGVRPTWVETIEKKASADQATNHSTQFIDLSKDRLGGRLFRSIDPVIMNTTPEEIIEIEIEYYDDRVNSLEAIQREANTIINIFSDDRNIKIDLKTIEMRKKNAGDYTQAEHDHQIFQTESHTTLSENLEQLRAPTLALYDTALSITEDDMVNFSIYNKNKKIRDMLTELSNVFKRVILEIGENASADQIVPTMIALSPSGNRYVNDAIISKLMAFSDLLRSTATDPDVSVEDRKLFNESAYYLTTMATSMQKKSPNPAAAFKHSEIMATTTLSSVRLKGNQIVGLINDVKNAQKAYENLGKTTHIKNFKELIQRLYAIILDADANKYQRAIAEIEKAYLKEQNAGSGFLKKNSPNKEPPSQFSKKVNDNEDSLHYPRMLAIILQKQNDAQPGAQPRSINNSINPEGVYPGRQIEYLPLAPITGDNSPDMTALLSTLNSISNQMGVGVNDFSFIPRDVDNARRFETPLLSNTLIDLVNKSLFNKLTSIKNFDPQGYIRNDEILKEMLIKIIEMIKKGEPMESINRTRVIEDVIESHKPGGPASIGRRTPINPLTTMQIETRIAQLVDPLKRIIHEENNLKPKPVQTARQSMQHDPQ